MFQFCGMSFADLAHLEKSALEQSVLRYNRIKTKTPMSVEVLDTARGMINQLRSNQEPIPGCPNYLFDILCGNKKRKDERAYREYQSALRRFNNRLKDLARALRLNSPVSSYTLRHSLSTAAAKTAGQRSPEPLYRHSDGKTAKQRRYSCSGTADWM